MSLVSISIIAAATLRSIEYLKGLQSLSIEINQVYILNDEGYHPGQREIDKAGEMARRIITFCRDNDIKVSTYMADVNSKELQEALALAAAHEMTLVVVYMPTLSQPFAESAAHPLASYGPARHAFAAVDAVQVDAAALLTDASYEALRLDPCCHYNAAGMALLAERLVDVLPAP